MFSIRNISPAPWNYGHWAIFWCDGRVGSKPKLLADGFSSWKAASDYMHATWCVDEQAAA